MHTPLTPGYKTDVAVLAYVAEVDPGAILGWALVTWLPGGDVQLAHNACCTGHVHDQLAWLVRNMPAELVPCSAEQ